MSNLSESQINHFLQNGYLALDDVLSEKEISDFISMAYYLACLKVPALEYDDTLTQAQKEHIIKYDVCQPVNESGSLFITRSHTESYVIKLLKKLLSSQRFIDISKQLLGTDVMPAELNCMLSILPVDKVRGIWNLHQDIPEDPINDDCAVFWIPLTEGYLPNFRVVSASHKLGVLPHDLFGQFKKVNPTALSALDVQPHSKSIKLNQCLIFNSKVLHSLEQNFGESAIWSISISFKRKLTH